MDNPIKEVSQEVIEAAKKHADEDKEIPDGGLWMIRYQSFIAGASFSKPQEHNAKPEDNGKQ
jgi:hypothetical protein